MLEAIELGLEAAEIIQMTTRRRLRGTGMKTTQSNNPSGKWTVINDAKMNDARVRLLLGAEKKEPEKNSLIYLPTSRLLSDFMF